MPPLSRYRFCVNSEPSLPKIQYTAFPPQFSLFSLSHKHQPHSYFASKVLPALCLNTDTAMLQPQPYSTASSASNNSISTHNTPHVLILGVGIGSEIFIRELLSNHIHLVVVDKHPILSTETMKQGKDSGLLTIITLDFAHLEQVETALAKLDFPITHTLSLPVGRALTFLGTLNDRYHFAGPSLATIDACTDKVKFHQLLQAHGLNNPRYLVLPPRTEISKHLTHPTLALSADEIKQAQSQLGFPLIIKPACGSGSQGVRYCADSSALKTYLLPERFAHQPLLLEEVISGQEYSTNFFVDEHGEIHMLGLFAKEISTLPYRQEVAYFVDDFSKAFAQISPYIKQIVAALGNDVRTTFFHADIIVNHQGIPYAIDVSPRMAGNAVLLLEQFCNTSPIKLFVQHVLKGQPLAAAGILPLPPQKAALRFFSFAHAGTVRAIVPKLTPKEQSHIVHCENHLSVGSTVGTMPDGRGLAQGYIIVAHDDLATANNLTHKYLDSFVITPKPSSANIITYENFDHCPLCGSKHFVVLPERHEIPQATPLAANELDINANIHFTPALCEQCGASFNIRGLSGHARDLLYRNYKFIKASTGTGAENYQTYIDTVKEAAKTLQLPKTAPILEVGDYDGYLLQVLAREGWQDLTLIDPSAQLDSIPPELNITVHQDFFGSKTAQDYDEHFPIIACKDTVYMVPQIPDFIEGLVNCLKPNGMLLLTASTQPHSLQYARLGKNAFAYIAHAFGLKLLSYFKRPKNTYGCALFVKPQDATTPVMAVQAQASNTDEDEFSATLHDADFVAEQEHFLQQLQSTLPFSLEDAHALEKHVQKALQSSTEPIVLYGTGFAAFNLLDCLRPETKAQLFNPPQGADPALSPSRLLLVNSNPQHEGYFFLLPNGQNHVVHYAGNALKDRHVSLVIVGALNPFFKHEIMQTLKALNCTYDQLFAAQAI